jgi:hypothetical protein
MACLRLPRAVVNRSGNIDRDCQGPCEDAHTQQNRQKRNEHSGTERNEFLHHVGPTFRHKLPVPAPPALPDKESAVAR